MSEEVDWNDLQPETVPDFEASKEPKKSLRERVSARSKSDETKAKPAPRARRTTTRKVSAPKKGAYVQSLTEMYTYLGMGVAIVDPTCANVVLESAENCAKSIDELAYQNESVRRALDMLTQSSAIGAVIMAHMPIAMAVLAHHGGLNKLSGLIVRTDNETVSTTES